MILIFHLLQDGDETGLSCEMQANVREKLFSMLGDRGRVAAAAVASSSSRTLINDKLQIESEKDNSIDKDNLSISHDVLHFEANDLYTKSNNGDLYDSNDELDEWVCSICTVINIPGTQICFTCESVKQ